MTDEQHICQRCGLPVLSGQPHHGATGNHWDCETAPCNRTRLWDLVATAMRNALHGRTDASEGIPGTEYCVIAKGGYRIHIKRSGTTQTLCGHEPKDTARKMRKRAGYWLANVEPVELEPGKAEAQGFRKGCAQCIAVFKNRLHL